MAEVEHTTPLSMARRTPSLTPAVSPKSSALMISCFKCSGRQPGDPPVSPARSFYFLDGPLGFGHGGGPVGFGHGGGPLGLGHPAGPDVPFFLPACVRGLLVMTITPCLDHNLPEVATNSVRISRSTSLHRAPGAQRLPSGGRRHPRPPAAPQRPENVRAA